MRESRKGPKPPRTPIKHIPTADERRAERSQQSLKISAERREKAMTARRMSAPATPGAAMPHSPFSPMHPAHAPFFAPHGMTPPSPFPMPAPSHSPLLHSPHSSSAMEVDTPMPHSAPSSSPLSSLAPPQPHAQPHAPLPALSQASAPKHALSQSPEGMARFTERSATERRREVMGLPAPVNRPSPELSNFHHDKGGPALGHQVKYGPGAGIGSVDQSELDTHYGEKTKPRLSQYSSNREHYVRAANEAGRPLTQQEYDVSKGIDPGPTSINHVIASGTGQNLMNQMTLQFKRGISSFNNAKVDQNQGGMLEGIAQQAAAVGRMTGIGRAIQSENAPHDPFAGAVSGNPGGADGSVRHAHLVARDNMMKKVLTAFQGNTPETRFGGYKGYLKNTFDSFGNLRLGHGTGNGRVSTGLDVPLTSSMTPTPRGERLYQANLTFGMPAMEAPRKVQGGGGNYSAGIFTTTTTGLKLTSSTQK